MSRSYRLTVPAVLFVVAVAYLWSGSSSPAQEKAKGADAPMAKWEYKVIDPGPVRLRDKWEKTLNDLGAEGWEVVGPVASVNGANASVYSEVGIILKRRK